MRTTTYGSVAKCSSPEEGYSMLATEILVTDNYSGTQTTSQFDFTDVPDGSVVSFLTTMSDEAAGDPSNTLGTAFEVTFDGSEWHPVSSAIWVGGPGLHGNPPSRPGQIYVMPAENRPSAGRLIIDTLGGTMLLGAEAAY
jgi:hypothetical protein